MDSDNFTPKGAFEGYVYSKLESMNERMNRLPCDETFKRLNKVENDVSNIKGKAAGIAAVISIAGVWLSKHIFGK